jgi:UDP-glucuronate 4-epimerase
MLFADAISNNKPIKVFNYGDLERDFTYIDDIVEGIVRVMDSIPSKDDSQPFYRLFKIGNSKPVQLLEFIELIEKSLGVKAQKEMLPMQAGDVKRTWADISKLHATVGYKPKTDLKEGITVYIDWYKRYYKKI